MKRMVALMALTFATTACDRAVRTDVRAEQSDGLYRAAMEDYRSGRLDAAIAGFGKVIRRDPANASARFQLACLLQDAKRDFAAAFCGYREYLLQQPGSDKAKLAADRLALCEQELAKELASKYGLDDANGARRELEMLRDDLEKARERVAAVERNLGDSQARVRSLSAERDRLVAVVKGQGADDANVSSGRPSVREARELLEEEDEETLDRVKTSADAAALLREEDDEIAAGSGLLPPKTPGASRAAHDEPSAADGKARPAEPSHPETYTVAEGDTLYGIAKRFYGRLSAWKAIRDANKAVIPADNRLKAGDTLRLP